MRRSLLQLKLLSSLASEPASSITALAQRLSAKRPSVSRSVRSLKDQGLVCRANDEWRLTDRGSREARLVGPRLIDELETGAKIAQRALFEIQTTPALNGELISLRDLLGSANVLSLFETTKVLSDLKTSSILSAPNPLSGLDTGSIFGATSALSGLDRSGVVGTMNAISGLDRSGVVGAMKAISGLDTSGVVGAMNALSGLDTGGVVGTMNALSGLDTNGVLGAVNARSGLDTSGVVGAMSALSGLDTNGVLGAVNALSGLESHGFLEGIRASVGSLLDAQSLYAHALPDSVGNWSDAVGRSGLLALGNLGTAQAVENIWGVASTVSELMEPPGWLQTLTAGLPSITSTFRDVLNSHLGGHLTGDEIWTRIAVPSITVERYSRALRIEAEEEEQFDTQTVPLRLGGDLDARLYRLNPDFPGMRAGGWLALNSDNPDRWRHAASSHRELIRMVLACLIPDVEEVPCQPGSKIRARVRAYLNSDSSADFAVSVADAVAKLYDYLNKPCHTLYRHEAIRGALVTGEGLLLFILSHSD